MKMEITKIDFGIEGIAPLKMDQWLDLPTPKTEKGYMEQAKDKVYRDDSGFLAIYENHLKGAMRMASSEVGKKTMAKKNRQTIKAQVFINPRKLSLGVKDYDGLARDIVSRRTGDKVATYRPYVEKWKTNGQFVLYGVDTEFIKEVLELAGFRYGLLSHRPEFGRFIVTKFEVVENGRKSK